MLVKQDREGHFAVTAYVSKNNLPVKVYKDYGLPAVEIPKVYATTEN